MSIIRPPRRLDLQPRRCGTMREHLVPTPAFRDPREQAVQVRVDPVPPEGLLMTIDAQTDKWTLLARIDYLQRCHLAAIDAGERTIATLASEKAELLRIAKEATNGWACYAKRQIEHDEIARLHAAIEKAEGR